MRRLTANSSVTCAGGFCRRSIASRSLQEYLVTEGDRLDNITAKYLGDPEAFWRVCDANPIQRPEELEEIGRRIRITLAGRDTGDAQCLTVCISPC